MRVGEHVTVCNITTGKTKPYHWVYEIIDIQQGVLVLRDVYKGINNPYLVIHASYVTRNGQGLLCSYSNCKLLAEKER